MYDYKFAEVREEVVKVRERDRDGEKRSSRL